VLVDADGQVKLCSITQYEQSTSPEVCHESNDDLHLALGQILQARPTPSREEHIYPLFLSHPSGYVLHRYDS
jgi:hypothetical protein